jgi:hypothetical protein
VGGAAFWSRAESWTISTIKIEGNSVVSSQEIDDVISRTLDGTYLFLFPKKNAPLYPKVSIEENILNTFPRIESVDVVLGDLKNIIVIVEEREAESLWCRDFPSTSSAFPECYFIDKQGLVFERAPHFSDDVYVRYFGTLGTSSSPIGQTFLPNAYRAMNVFVAELRDSSIFRPHSVVVKSDGDIEVAVAGDGKIIFNENQDYATVRRNLQSVVDGSAFKLQALGSPLKFKYIDLRFDNKIFYSID